MSNGLCLLLQASPLARSQLDASQACPPSPLQDTAEGEVCSEHILGASRLGGALASQRMLPKPAGAAAGGLPRQGAALCRHALHTC